MRIAKAIVIVPATIALLTIFWWIERSASHAQGAPFVMSPIDAANWRAVNAELANMEKQYFDAIRPDQDVRNELAARNCAIAKLELKDCSITQDPTNRSRIIVSHVPAPVPQSQPPTQPK